MHQLESVSKPLVALHNVWLPPVETPTKPPSTCEYMHVDISPNWCPLCTSGPSNSEFSIREFKVSWFSILYSLKSVRSLSYSLKLVHSLSQRFLSQFILSLKLSASPLRELTQGCGWPLIFPLFSQVVLHGSVQILARCYSYCARLTPPCPVRRIVLIVLVQQHSSPSWIH